MSERLLSKNFQAARWLVSALLAGSTAASFLLDWSPNHLLHPAWHPHAKFHGALLLFFLGGTALALLSLIWGAQTSGAAVRAAAGVMAAYWSPLFYVPFVLPGATWWAGTPGAEPRWAGYVVYPNLVVAGSMMLAAGAVWWLCRSEP